MDVAVTKTCRRCRSEKPLTDFGVRSDRASGRSDCKSCVRRKRQAKSVELGERARRELGTEQTCRCCGTTKPLSDFTPHNTSRTGISKKCRSCISNDSKKTHPLTLDPLYPRAETLRAYNLTLAEYDDLLRTQDGTCAICRKRESRILRGRRANLCVDHDHKTGKVRGLLCSRCNIALGGFRDDASLLSAALDYLAKYRHPALAVAR